RGAQEEKRGAGDGPRSMAAEASARKELFAAPDALIEGAEPTLKGRLASDDPRRDWNADAARDQIRRDREARPPGCDRGDRWPRPPDPEDRVTSSTPPPPPRPAPRGCRPRPRPRARARP